MEPATYNFKPHTKGDTYQGTTGFSVSVNNTPLSLADASIRMQFRLSPQHPVSHEFSTAGGQITIDQPDNLIFRIAKQIIDFPAGVYVYDIEITTPDRGVQTYLKGTWNQLQDVTR